MTLLIAGNALGTTPVNATPLEASTVMAASQLSATAANSTGSEADDVVLILETVSTEIPVMQVVSTAEATDLVALGMRRAMPQPSRMSRTWSVSVLGENPLFVQLLAAQDAVAVSHAIWGRAIIDAGYPRDLELSRPANANYGNVLAHQCNW